MRRRQFATAATVVVVAAVTFVGCGGQHVASVRTVEVTVTTTVPATTTTQTVAHRRAAEASRLKAERARKAAAAKRAAATARARKAAAAKRAAAVARARKAAQQAAAEANAWHKDYIGPVGENLDVYGRWRTDLTCASYAANGCLHFEVITANGCRYLQVSVNELRNGAIVGDILANQINVPAKTPVILELDADEANIESSSPTIDCQNY